METADGGAWAELIREGRWGAFSGLPHELPERELLEVLDKVHAVSHVRAGTLSGVPVTVVESDLLRYWTDDQSNVLLVEMHEPPSSLTVSGLLSVMGEAEREGSGRYRRYGVMMTEYVYPTRGIALTIGESYDEPPTFEPMLAAVHLFVATDLADYDGRLGGSDALAPPPAGPR
jgi:hypothetical protein